MSRTILTDRKVRAITPPEKGQVDYFDERLTGFALRASQGGRKSWIVTYRHAGRFRRLTIGPYPRLSLADARREASKALHAATQGRDPAEEKQVVCLEESFDELAHEYLEKHAKVHKRSWAEDDRILKRELLPRWRRVKAKSITRRHVRRILDGIMERGSPIQANRTLALVRKIFNFGMQRDMVEVNPCHGLTRPGQERQRDRVLSPDEMRKFWKALDAVTPARAAIFKLLLLTAQRVGEVLTIRRADLDLAGRWWTIPAERSKNGLAHRVPLSKQALAILQTMLKDTGDCRWVFPSADGNGPVTTLQKAVRRIRRDTKMDFRPHDLRRTAASHMTGVGINRLTVAKILNHAEREVTAVYDRHSYDQEKRQALEAWGARLEKIVTGTQRSTKVVPLRRG
jgi:integrase